MNEEPAEITKADTLSSRKLGFAFEPDGDLEIFKYLNEYRMLQREQLSFLTGRSPAALHRRLLKLVNAGYVTPKKIALTPHIYRLTKAGITVLVEEGIAEPHVLSRRSRTHELSEQHLKHEMMIRDIHLILSRAGSDGQLKVIKWREGEELTDVVSIPERGRIVEQQFTPDGFFSVEDLRWPAPSNVAHFFLEADRSTENHPTFAPTKILTYWHYLETGKVSKKHGIQNFRVVTVTKSHKRAENLSLLVARLLPAKAHKYFLFTSIENVSFEKPEPIWREIYIRPGSSERYPLVRPPRP